ncbi:antibiotic biosynthesis monooxygenase family protein [Pseudoponticoccus marisrubri]|uniref:Antibiotic biosynthesis monooxygenase n=1 Tax=Pseudoponticoccus marisrubri TaxID=1685382 RepID=A0A0W7WF36_9RHOB|nr:antibiotic biosynthesis monooxygenase [Pseudoponticoccus marisrubri]KUF09248.1 antibiotic biosynthesis monooxygenase [Pseudoponticoccus marisrubri]
MIVEHAQVRVTPGAGAAFAQAVAQARREVFPKAKGWLGLELHRCVEAPDSYIVAISWETLENHTVDFREGPLFRDWRALVGPHLADPPSVLHYETVDLA